MNAAGKKLIQAVKSLKDAETQVARKYYQTRIDRFKHYLAQPHLTPMTEDQVRDCIAFAATRLADLKGQA